MRFPRGLATAGLVIAACVPAMPQLSATGAGMISIRSENTESIYVYNLPLNGVNVPTVGAAYSGRKTSEMVRTLANGTHLRNVGRYSMEYRDSMGRTRTDSPLVGQQTEGQPQPSMIADISDPVAGYRYILDLFHQVAHRVPIEVHEWRLPARPPSGAVMMSRPTVQQQSGPNGETVVREDLGMQTMFGVTVTGIRTTTTYPVSTYQGNDRPVSRAMETWSAPRYGLQLLFKDSGPENETTTTMADFSTVEPDSALFQIPAGYQIVDEAGQFTITIPRNGH